MTDIDVARLERALDLHGSDVYHPEAYNQFGQITTCGRYCGPDIARRYGDPNLMELTDDEEAAEAAT